MSSLANGRWWKLSGEDEPYLSVPAAVLASIIVLTTRVGPLLALMPNQAIPRVVASALVRAAALAELASLAICPALGRLRDGIHLSATLLAGGRAGLNPVLPSPENETWV